MDIQCFVHHVFICLLCYKMTQMHYVTPLFKVVTFHWLLYHRMERNPACICTIANDLNDFCLSSFNFHSRPFIWCCWHSCQIKRHKGSLLWDEDGWQHTCPYKHQTKSFSRCNRKQKSKAVAMHASLRTQSPSGASKASLTPPYSPYRVWSTSGTGLNFWDYTSVFLSLQQWAECMHVLLYIWRKFDILAINRPVNHQRCWGVFRWDFFKPFYIRSSPSRTFGYIL